MKNLKYVIGLACFGFLLSILMAATHHVAPAPAAMRALISAVVFGGIGFVAVYLFGHLLQESYTDGVTIGVPAAKKSNSVNQIVNLHIEPEDLPSQADEAAFVVGGGHQMLTPSDVNPESSFGKSGKDVGGKRVRQKPSNNTNIDNANNSSGNNNTSQENIKDADKDQAQGKNDESFVAPEAGEIKPNDFKPITLGVGKNGTGKDIDRAVKKSESAEEELDTLPDLSDMTAGDIETPNVGDDAPPQKNEEKTLLDDELDANGEDKKDKAYVGGSSTFAKQNATGVKKQEEKNNDNDSTDKKSAPPAKKEPPASSVETSPSDNQKDATPPPSQPGKESTPPASKSPDKDDVLLDDDDDDDDLNAEVASDSEDDEDDGGEDSYLPSESHLEANKIVEGKDVETMAKAVSTLLLRGD